MPDYRINIQGVRKEIKWLGKLYKKTFGDDENKYKPRLDYLRKARKILKNFTEDPKLSEIEICDMEVKEKVNGVKLKDFFNVLIKDYTYELKN